MLFRSDVERLRKEAELHAAEDAKRKEAVEARNALDNLAYQVEKQVKDAGDKVPADVKAKLETAVADAKKVLDNKEASKAELEAEMEKLRKLVEENAQAFQAQPEAAQGQAAPEQGGAPNNGPVDADFEVVDDKKDE